MHLPDRLTVAELRSLLRERIRHTGCSDDLYLIYMSLYALLEREEHAEERQAHSAMLSGSHPL